MKTKAAKAAARCGDIGYSGAACCDVYCCPEAVGFCCCWISTPDEAPRAKAVEADRAVTRMPGRQGCEAHGNLPATATRR